MGSHAIAHIDESAWLSQKEEAPLGIPFGGEIARSLLGRLGIQVGDAPARAEDWSLDHLLAMVASDSPLIWALQEWGFTVRRSDLLGELLSEDLVSLLSEATGWIQVVFGQSSPMTLEAVDFDGEQQVVVRIGTKKEPSEALALLRKFDKAWWLKAKRRAQGKLLFNLEFV